MVAQAASQQMEDSDSGGTPYGYTWDGDGGEHIVYWASDGHVWEIFKTSFDWSTWNSNDLTAATGATNPVSDPHAYFWYGENIVYFAVDGLWKIER